MTASNPTNAEKLVEDLFESVPDHANTQAPEPQGNGMLPPHERQRLAAIEIKAILEKYKCVQVSVTRRINNNEWTEVEVQPLVPPPKE